MIGLVIVTHGRLADELKLATEHVVGPLDQLATVCIGADDDLELASSAVYDAVKAVDTGTGVMLLTDMFGGTPSNLSISLLGRANVEVVAGVNLPMLIKLSEARLDLSLAEAAQTAKQAGRHYIAIASEVIAGEIDE
ncbi:MAG: PTS fructose transporter subunit IIA [Robiginitomaculum sp.]|nr:MAG: PTS fructose transporter subunit IIA [Robiginitomaculum sp.]PHS77564.1 MAG: PTS fructose transporter subunit IIA [Robiginitomaculum sp.]